MSGPFGSSPWGYNPGGNFYPRTIDQSLRFNDNDSAYLSRTPSSAGSLTTWTWSGWVKRGNLAAGMPARGTIFGSSLTLFGFFNATSGVAADNFGVYITDGLDDRFITNRVFRDTSTWYHFVVVLDTTNSTADDRFRLYVNGVRETSFLRADAITQNRTAGVNAAAAHAIGRQSPAASQYFDGYLAEINFIDGTALTADSFGETKNGIWIPKNTSGLTFGTNGFYLPFDDSSAIGDDESGNTNDWTVNNLAASDVVPDSPTNNFATLNSLQNSGGGGSWVGQATLSEGNLQASLPANSVSVASMKSTGKLYAEVRWSTVVNELALGLIIPEEYTTTTAHSISTGPNSWRMASHAYAPADIYLVDEGTSVANPAQAVSAGDIFQVAWDTDGGKIWFGYNNSWYDSSGGTTGNPSTGANATMTATTADLEASLVYIASGNATGVGVINFGQDSTFAGAISAGSNADANGIGDFAYAPPSGFLAICASNLPEPTISPNSAEQADDHFNTVLWTGNGASSRAISGVGFSPDFVWAKQRGQAIGHALYDSVRGAGNDKELSSDSTAAEGGGNNDQYGYLSSFDSDGFTGVDGTGSPNYYFNENSQTFVAWNWKAGTAFSNDASATSVGTIDSDGQVNTKAGFSIVSYTGTGSAGTVAHGLGVAPLMVMIKSRVATSADGNWLVYVKAGSVDETDYLLLNGTGQAEDEAGAFNDTAATTTTFSLGTFPDLNQSSKTYIAYCFANVEGYSKVGSYTGNGNADGTFVFTGHRPSFLLIKRTDAAGTNWWIFDNKRSTFNVVNDGIITNGSDAEFADNSSLLIDFLSNGFKVRNTYGDLNTSGANHIFLSFAESPFKYANAR